MLQTTIGINTGLTESGDLDVKGSDMTVLGRRCLVTLSLGPTHRYTTVIYVYMYEYNVSRNGLSQRNGSKCHISTSHYQFNYSMLSASAEGLLSSI